MKGQLERRDLDTWFTRRRVIVCRCKTIFLAPACCLSVVLLLSFRRHSAVVSVASVSVDGCSAILLLPVVLSVSFCPSVLFVGSVILSLCPLRVPLCPLPVPSVLCRCRSVLCRCSSAPYRCRLDFRLCRSFFRLCRSFFRRSRSVVLFVFVRCCVYAI